MKLPLTRISNIDGLKTSGTNTDKVGTLSKNETRAINIQANVGTLGDEQEKKKS